MIVDKKSGRKVLRDVVVRSLVKIPLPLRLSLWRHFRRVVLRLLFLLETETVTLSMAGPDWLRYPMKLNWQGHTDYVLGIYEPQVCEAIRKHVKAGDFCIDCGAHLGYYSILLAHLVGEKGWVIAFEPYPQNFAILRENISLNALRNIKLEPLALAQSGTRLELFFDTNEPLSLSPSALGYAVHEPSKIVVPACSLDDYLMGMENIKEKYPNFIKIDTEGAEYNILCGALRLLERRPIILWEAHGFDTSLERRDETRLLYQFGYRVLLLGRRSREAFCLAVPG